MQPFVSCISKKGGRAQANARPVVVRFAWFQLLMPLKWASAWDVFDSAFGIEDMQE